MKEEIHRHLDGDLARAELTEADQAESRSWDRLLDAFRVEMGPTLTPSDLEERVMAEIAAIPEAGPVRRGLDWVLRPRPVRVSPLGWGAAAAVLATVFLFRGFLPGPAVRSSQVDGETQTQAARPPAVVVYAQFALDAPGASSVAVAGDFDGWEGENQLEDLDGDGIWTGRVAVRPGVYAYMFLVDGATWRTDPRAERYAEDGFGNRNAVLAVAAPET
jgi:hypothetical protein